MKITAILSTLFLMSSASASEPWTATSCKESIAHAYNGYELRDAAPASGDYNDDGHSDFAFLLDRQSKKAAIGVCLSGVGFPVAITNIYVSGHISTKVKGTRYMNFDTETESTYERDVISVDDGAWIGASYVLRQGIFVEVVDRD